MILRGAVVGLGVMGSHHARVLGSLEDVELRALIDPDPARRPTHASLAEALAAEPLDFVCVAVPVEQLPVVAGRRSPPACTCSWRSRRRRPRRRRAR